MPSDSTDHHEAFPPILWFPPNVLVLLHKLFTAEQKPQLMMTSYNRRSHTRNLREFRSKVTGMAFKDGQMFVCLSQAFKNLYHIIESRIKSCSPQPELQPEPWTWDRSSFAFKFNFHFYLVNVTEQAIRAREVLTCFHRVEKCGMYAKYSSSVFSQWQPL